MTDEEIERLNNLENRVIQLENLIQLIMNLKKAKLDISNFTCEKIQLGGTHTK